MSETIYSMFKKVVEKYHDETAIIENERTLTFGDLSDMVDRISESFPSGTKSVGIVMHHCAEMVASMLAVLKCGARYVPAEPSFPTARIQYMMKEAEVDFVFTEKGSEDKLGGLPLMYIDPLADAGKVSKVETAVQNPLMPAYVLYTSGTTGRPKGVCVSNANVCHYVHAFNEEFKVTRNDIMLQYSVCSFDIFVEEVFASLLNGASLAIPDDADKSDIISLMNFIGRHNVTIVSGFPYLFADMNRLPKIPSSLRLLVSGGDVLRHVYIDHLLGQAEVYNTYGPSETTVCCSYYHCNDGYFLDDGTYPVGHPVSGTRIRILDSRNNEVPKGVTGEICICGDGVSLGYIGDHDEENKAFVTCDDGSRMYMSGDLGYILPDGNIAFLHRKDTQIMIYGKRVEISEVESRLNQCKGVREALVRAFVDKDGLSYMIAYVVLDDEDIKVSEIKKELSEYLTYFMIPEYFVKMSSIPLNANGKPDASQLPVVMKEGSYHEN